MNAEVRQHMELIRTAFEKHARLEGYRSKAVIEVSSAGASFEHDLTRASFKIYDKDGSGDRRGILHIDNYRIEPLLEVEAVAASIFDQLMHAPDQFYAWKPYESSPNLRYEVKTK